MSGIVLTTNQAWGLLSTAVATTDTTITLQSGQGARFPIITGGSGNWFYVTLIDSSNNLERCLVTATSGDQFTVTRGVDGSSPRAFAASNRVELRWNSALITDLQNQINTVQTNLTNAVAALISELNTAFPNGIITLWKGSVASIPTGWALCNGAGGTIDLRDRFVVGAGNSYNPGVAGGSTTATLSTSNLPSHNHGVNDPGHAHGVNDPTHSHTVNIFDGGHSHGVNDPSHSHSNPAGGWGQAGTDNGGGTFISGPNQYGSRSAQNTNGAYTGISIQGSGSNITANSNGAYTGISIYGSGTGISIQNTGGGAAFSILPPYYGVCYIMRTGAFS